ncbi:MAG: SDR family NAD(P)-dependent oxidoreductase [Pseudomonadota bacterium]
MKQLDGQCIAITGAAGGIGSLLCQRLVERGAHVVGIDRLPSPEANSEMIADLGSFEGIADLGAKLDDLGPDMLVNLAGIQYFGPLQDQSPENLWTGYVINLIAPAMLSRAVVPGMRARRQGRIVNIGSVFGSIPFAHFVSYSSAKAGLKGFSQALRRELAGSGVEVTHVAPRAVRTPLNSERVMALAEITKMHLDAPEYVADRIASAIEKGERDVVIGFPESVFVRLNALMPTMIDKALASNDRKAAAIFN